LQKAQNIENETEKERRKKMKQLIKTKFEFVERSEKKTKQRNLKENDRHKF